ncbi:MAG: hypothetical protein IPO97_11895 [Sphingomonadales bacterium]|nr:hypothetical protein [Sphingomonadales bacterium]
MASTVSGDAPSIVMIGPPLKIVAGSGAAFAAASARDKRSTARRFIGSA